MAEKDKSPTPGNPLTAEQQELLYLYLEKLDMYFEQLKASEKVQVEIETAHLKKILGK